MKVTNMDDLVQKYEDANQGEVVFDVETAYYLGQLSSVKYVMALAPLLLNDSDESKAFIKRMEEFEAMLHEIYASQIVGG